MPESIQELNNLPSSQFHLKQLNRLKLFPRPDQLYALQLLQDALEKDQVREDLRSEVLYLLNLQQNGPDLAADLLGLKEERFHNPAQNESPRQTILSLLEIVEAVALEGGELPRNFL